MGEGDQQKKSSGTSSSPTVGARIAPIHRTSPLTRPASPLSVQIPTRPNSPGRSSPPLIAPESMNAGIDAITNNAATDDENKANIRRAKSTADLQQAAARNRQTFDTTPNRPQRSASVDNISTPKRNSNASRPPSPGSAVLNNLLDGHRRIKARETVIDSSSDTHKATVRLLKMMYNEKLQQDYHDEIPTMLWRKRFNVFLADRMVSMTMFAVSFVVLIYDYGPTEIFTRFGLLPTLIVGMVAGLFCLGFVYWQQLGAEGKQTEFDKNDSKMRRAIIYKLLHIEYMKSDDKVLTPALRQALKIIFEKEYAWNKDPADLGNEICDAFDDDFNLLEKISGYQALKDHLYSEMQKRVDIARDEVEQRHQKDGFTVSQSKRTASPTFRALWPAMTIAAFSSLSPGLNLNLFMFSVVLIFVYMAYETDALYQNKQKKYKNEEAIRIARTRTWLQHKDLERSYLNTYSSVNGYHSNDTENKQLEENKNIIAAIISTVTSYKVLDDSIHKRYSFAVILCTFGIGSWVFKSAGAILEFLESSTLIAEGAITSNGLTIFLMVLFAAVAAGMIEYRASYHDTSQRHHDPYNGGMPDEKTLDTVKYLENLHTEKSLTALRKQADVFVAKNKILKIDLDSIPGAKEEYERRLLRGNSLQYDLSDAAQARLEMNSWINTPYYVNKIKNKFFYKPVKTLAAVGMLASLLAFDLTTSAGTGFALPVLAIFLGFTLLVYASYREYDIKTTEVCHMRYFKSTIGALVSDNEMKLDAINAAKKANAANDKNYDDSDAETATTSSSARLLIKDGENNTNINPALLSPVHRLAGTLWDTVGNKNGKLPATPAAAARSNSNAEVQSNAGSPAGNIMASNLAATAAADTQESRGIMGTCAQWYKTTRDAACSAAYNVAYGTASSTMPDISETLRDSSIGCIDDYSPETQQATIVKNADQLDVDKLERMNFDENDKMYVAGSSPRKYVKFNI